MSPIVLIVEDDVVLRLTLADHLYGCGFEVREAADAHCAINILQSPNCLINLVISDVRMPGEIDGLDLYQWVRLHRPGMPVILTTGDGSKVAAVTELCGSHAMIKPYDLDVATHTILDIVSNQPQA